MICNPTHLLSADTTTLKNTLDFRQCYMWEPPWQSCQKSNITNLSSQPHGVHIKTLVTNPHFQREMSNLTETSQQFEDLHYLLILTPWLGLLLYYKLYHNKAMVKCLSAMKLINKYT